MSDFGDIAIKNDRKTKESFFMKKIKKNQKNIFEWFYCGKEI